MHCSHHLAVWCLTSQYIAVHDLEQGLLVPLTTSFSSSLGDQQLAIGCSITTATSETAVHRSHFLLHVPREVCLTTRPTQHPPLIVPCDYIQCTSRVITPSKITPSKITPGALISQHATGFVRYDQTMAAQKPPLSSLLTISQCAGGKLEQEKK